MVFDLKEGLVECATVCVKSVVILKGAVNKHVLIVHEGKIPSFPCETCGKNFTAKAKLKSHVLTVHEGVKPYKCDYENCEAAFTGIQNLEGHILTIHKGKRYKTLQMW